MKTNERSLRNESCSACSTLRKKTLRARDARRDVAEHEDLRAAAGAAGGTCSTTGTPPVCSEARIVRAHVDVRVALAPAQLVALGRQPALELGDDAVHGGEVLQRPARQRAVELVQRPRGRQRLRCARSGARSSSRRRCASKRRSCVARQTPSRARVVLRAGRAGARRAGPSARRMRCTSTPMHARALARRAERGDGQPREVAHRAPRRRRAAPAAICWRSVVEVDARRRRRRSPPPSVTPSRSGRRLGGAEEEAVEHEVEDAPVLRATSRASRPAPP